MEHNFKALQNENYQLREYILSLQSRLLETQSDYPPAPAPSQVNQASTSAPANASHAPEPSSAADQRLRRDMHPPSDPVQAGHDAISQLRAAAAHADAPQHQSPYGLGEDYPHKRTRPEDASARPGDAKTPQ